MRGRSARLTCLALVLGPAALLLAAGTARAHRLVARCQVLPGQKVQVEARYQTIPRSTPAVEARVQAFGPGRRLVAEGQTDDNGLFVFSYQKAEPLTVEVYQDGHLRKDTVSAGALRQAAAATAKDGAAKSDNRPPVHSTTPAPAGPQMSEDTDASGWQEQIKNVVIGTGFLLALAAFVISLRNARHLKQLSHRNPESSEKQTNHGSPAEREGTAT
jgi:hypothetical protein